MKLVFNWEVLELLGKFWGCFSRLWQSLACIFPTFKLTTCHTWKYVESRLSLPQVTVLLLFPCLSLFFPYKLQCLYYLTNNMLKSPAYSMRCIVKYMLRILTGFYVISIHAKHHCTTDSGPVHGIIIMSQDMDWSEWLFSLWMYFEVVLTYCCTYCFTIHKYPNDHGT